MVQGRNAIAPNWTVWLSKWYMSNCGASFRFAPATSKRKGFLISTEKEISKQIDTGCPVKIRTTLFKNITFFVIARFIYYNPQCIKNSVTV
jgi:hypothetical protein